MTKIKICFHALNAYSLFNTQTHFIYGGAEYRASLIAKELAKDHKFYVQFITLGHSQPASGYFEKVNVLADRFYKDEHETTQKTSLYIRLKDKLSFLMNQQNELDFANYFRFFTLKKAASNFYIIFGISGLNKRVVDFCKKNNKKMILSFASDEELNLEPSNSLGLDKDIITYFINNSSLIFCQNKFQQNALMKLFSKKGILLLNPIHIDSPFVDKSSNEKKKIIWIGKSNDIKDPQTFISIARSNSEKNFVMYCNKSDHVLHAKLIKDLPTNVKFIDNAGSTDIEQALKEAHILISTSIIEGFPNVFLQAGKSSIPVISLRIDPNNYVKTYRCGFVCEGNIEQLDNQLKMVYDDKQLYYTLAYNHYSYVQKFHSIQNVIALVKTVIENEFC